MATDIQKLFTSLGLSPTETKIYLSSLELGPTSVQEIAKKAKISRTAAYDAIESLQKHSLLSTFERGKKHYFAAEDPESAVAHFKTELSNMQAQLENLQRVLPELKMMTGGERPTVRFFEGEEAVYAVFRDVAKVEPKEVFEMTNYEDVNQFIDMKVLAEARKLLNLQRTKLHILHRGHHSNPNSLIEYCELLSELGNFHGDIWIYENRVVFVTFLGKIITVIIESKPLADTARILFKAAWTICHK